ncbi:GspE/PulE family protein [Kamptonema cortianum]|nr:GspE/PulE family protein [Geitlerinema splendidum]MDK3158626.1 GspE/PulE family protein [Kamptonema cortianum]
MLTGDVFVDEGLITPYQLELAVEKQVEMGGTEPIARVMVDMGMISERDRVRCLGKVWDIAFADLSEVQPQSESLKLINPKFAKKFKCLPIRSNESVLSVAMANPLDVFVIDELRSHTGLEIQPLIAVEEDLENALKEAYPGDVSVASEISSMMSDFDADVDLTTVAEADDDDGIAEAEDAPIIRLANLIVNQAVNDKASDIHIEPRKDEVVVRQRIDGVMVEAMRLPRKVAAALTSRFKIIANMDIAERRAPQDNRISAVINGQEYDFRVSTLPVVYGEKIVMRVLDKGSINVGLEKLGFLEHNYKTLVDLATRSYGIVLVTGPTGSGKSTTLYSLINQSNDGLKNIITIEDPVEYELASINQCSVNNKAGMTFAAGLRAMMRQDPDVIMVGEMRDEETATIAMEAAMTGHLVFSTLHTNDAPSTAGRLMDMGVEPFLIASSIVGILAQRLIRVLCPNCKKEVEVSVDEFRRFGFPVEDIFGPNPPSTVKVFEACGCDRCKGGGYKGRMGIHEMLTMNDDLRNLILHKAPAHEIRTKAIESGMKTLAFDAAHKILAGHTSIEEVVRVIYS